MGLQEYFINEESKKCSNETFGEHINAANITPVFDLEKNTVIHVDRKEIDCAKRRFCYQALDGYSPTPLLIENGVRYLNSEIAGIVSRDNLFPVALTWKTRSGDMNTVVFIFYNDDAYIRFNGISWLPVGPASMIDIRYASDGIGACYMVSYNHYQLNEVLGCAHLNSIFDYRESFGMDWLASTLNYRADYLGKQKNPFT